MPLPIIVDMSDFNACTTASVAMAAFMSFLAALSLVDSWYLREIPPLVTKARVVLFIFELTKTAQAVASADDEAIRAQAWLSLLYMGTLQVLVLYFMENFVVVWVTLLSGVSEHRNTKRHVERTFFGCRIFGTFITLAHSSSLLSFAQKFHC